MMELSYSFHLGNDSNKTIKARQEAKNTLSGTTNKSNNAIQNVKQLGKINHHNLRQYNNNQELIQIIKGSNDITKDVKKLYFDLFEEARLEYNNKQIREDRKIDNYFNKISSDNKHDLACEIIIELGDMAYWEDKSLEYKYEMIKVFKMQLDDLKENMVLTGTIRNVVDFGAFVDIGIKNDGLVHISEMSDKYIKNPSDVVSVGDIVKVKVIGIDKDRQKVSLSMKL